MRESWMNFFAKAAGWCIAKVIDGVTASLYRQWIQPPGGASAEASV
jgi:hypothetical protein